LTAKGAVTMNKIEKLRAELEAQLRVVAEARYLVRAAEVEAKEAANRAAMAQREYQSKREDLKAMADEVTGAMADERSSQHASRYATTPEQATPEQTALEAD
jgi:predicted  nucleic acid-binding Zn-ribbon protein